MESDRPNGAVGNELAVPGATDGATASSARLGRVPAGSGVGRKPGGGQSLAALKNAVAQSGIAFRSQASKPASAPPIAAAFRMSRSATKHFKSSSVGSMSASRDCTSKDCAPTIAPKILIGRFDDAKERCKVSNQSSRLSALFPSMRPLQHVQRSTAFNQPADPKTISDGSA